MLGKFLLAALAAAPARAKLTPNWKVVADSLGVTTRARMDPETQWCAVSRGAEIDGACFLGARRGAARRFSLVCF